VKVYGIPLHVWGENLFKAIGGKYGEFLDFDNSTASRAKLDIACLKIATDFRGKIDESVMIKAMGVCYTLRVVEDKIVERGFFCGERLVERESSWVESVNCPEAEKVVAGGSNGCSEEDGFPFESNQLHGNPNLHDGDVTVALEGKRQNQPFVSGEIVEDQIGKLVQHVYEGETFAADQVENCGAQEEKVEGGDRGVETESEDSRVMETCHLGKGGESTGGSENCGELLEVNRTRVVLSEPGSQSTKTRPASLPPNRPVGPLSSLGRDKKAGMDFSDSISLIEFTREEDDLPQVPISNTQNLELKAVGRRGRSRKPKDKSKFPKLPSVGKPKFLQLEEAMKEGACRGRKKKQDAGSKDLCDGGNTVTISDAHLLQVDAIAPPAPTQCPFQEVFLEVVLPTIQPTLASGMNILQQGDIEDGLQNGATVPETKKLLQIQQKVGFCYKETDEEVIKVLTNEEKRDKSKKQDWEQKHGFQ
jgi:hypothetical protein